MSSAGGQGLGTQDGVSRGGGVGSEAWGGVGAGGLRAQEGQRVT